MTVAINVKDLNAWYGESHILHGVNLLVNHGEIVSLLGRNGSGRTTFLRALLGLVSKRTGSIEISNVDAIKLETHHIANLGIGYCPEERGIFSSLSCEENLLLPPILKDKKFTGVSLEKIYELFPNLYERRNSQGTKLSGGEQQMLALARILRTGARILLLDEISEGLAPVIVQKIAEMILYLKGKGYTVLMVEQNHHFSTPLADRFMIMDHGQIVDDFLHEDLSSKQETLARLLSV